MDKGLGWGYPSSRLMQVSVSSRYNFTSLMHEAARTQVNEVGPGRHCGSREPQCPLIAATSAGYPFTETSYVASVGGAAKLAANLATSWR